MQSRSSGLIGPILIVDDISGGQIRLAALVIARRNEAPPPFETGNAEIALQRLAEGSGISVWRARFSVPANARSRYRFGNDSFEIASDLTRDMRIAYVSCNGEEIGDMDREGAERNAMWARLKDEHLRQPFSLMLHGGDQVYADEVTDGHRLSNDWPKSVPDDPSDEELADLREHLRSGFFERYAALYAAPQMAWLCARVPSLMQWDDHDICDGWGSLKRRATHSAVGRTLFEVAKEMVLLFQHATTEDDLPPRFASRKGTHLGWVVNAPGLRIIAPDLRGERSRRNIMGVGGWAMMDAEADRAFDGHTFLMSSVPLLGPRLSLFEAAMMVIPKMQKYEDDLRDQWQSRAHREEWRRMLRLVREMARRDGHSVTALSGEIHLATRATMDLGDGLELNQLVSSGISHRAPPRTWARILGGVAALGEDPLADHPITIRPLPGHKHRYIAERNYLVLVRKSEGWSAEWELEKDGRSEALGL
jgi:alkaline phosphatase D